MQLKEIDSNPGDLCNLVVNDLEELGIYMEEKQKILKDLEKTKVELAAFKFLLEKQQTHSKIPKIYYNTLELQTYLYS